MRHIQRRGSSRKGSMPAADIAKFPITTASTDKESGFSYSSNPSSSGFLTEQKLVKVSVEMMAYPLAYALIWAAPTIIMIYAACTTYKVTPLILTGVMKVGAVIQGFVDAGVYGM